MKLTERETARRTYLFLHMIKLELAGLASAVADCAASFPFFFAIRAPSQSRHVCDRESRSRSTSAKGKPLCEVREEKATRVSISLTNGLSLEACAGQTQGGVGPLEI